jgi:hypothetical protein
MIMTTAPLEVVMFDLTFMPMPTPDGLTCILSVIDHFTKYKWAKAFEDKTAQPICDFLLNVFRVEGAPQRFHCDNGSEFINECMDRVMEKLGGTRASHGLPYNPRCQGLVEKMNDTMKARILKQCRVNGWRLGDCEHPWDEYLQDQVYGENTSVVRPYNLTPFLCLRLRPHQSPGSEMLGAEEVKGMFSYMSMRQQEQAQSIEQKYSQFAGGEKFREGVHVRVRADKQHMRRKKATAKYSQQGVIQERDDHGYCRLQWTTSGLSGENPGTLSKRKYHFSRLVIIEQVKEPCYEEKMAASHTSQSVSSPEPTQPEPTSALTDLSDSMRVSLPVTYFGQEWAKDWFEDDALKVYLLGDYNPSTSEVTTLHDTSVYSMKMGAAKFYHRLWLHQGMWEFDARMCVGDAWNSSTFSRLSAGDTRNTEIICMPVVSYEWEWNHVWLKHLRGEEDGVVDLTNPTKSAASGTRRSTSCMSEYSESDTDHGGAIVKYHMLDISEKIDAAAFDIAQGNSVPWVWDATRVTCHLDTFLMAELAIFSLEDGVPRRDLRSCRDSTSFQGTQNDFLVVLAGASTGYNQQQRNQLYDKLQMHSSELYDSNFQTGDHVSVDSHASMLANCKGGVLYKTHTQSNTDGSDEHRHRRCVKSTREMYARPVVNSESSTYISQYITTWRSVVEFNPKGWLPWNNRYYGVDPQASDYCPWTSPVDCVLRTIAQPRARDAEICTPLRDSVHMSDIVVVNVNTRWCNTTGSQTAESDGISARLRSRRQFDINVLKLDSTTSSCNYEYTLVSVIYGNGRHFVSKVLLHSNWYYYDDVGDPIIKRCDPPYVNSVDKYGYTPYLLHYVRTHHHKADQLDVYWEDVQQVRSTTYSVEDLTSS